jgi:superfamily I DNA/RNA helicase
MRILPSVIPTPEQLAVLAANKPGFTLIRGAAGSGKTTTALLRLQQLTGSWLNRRERLGIHDPVRILVLTFNRTLEGYISELARRQIVGRTGLQLEVRTFGKWAYGLLDRPEILDRDGLVAMLRPHAAALPGDTAFLVEEVEYLLSRFEPENLGAYLSARRDGRGISPRVEQPLRRRLLEEVVAPYAADKRRRGVLDWNDIAIEAGRVRGVPPWDVVIIDEAQDFSANQVRAVLAHLADPFSLTFVLDAMQRIYPRYFTWAEVGVSAFASRHKLSRNHRNTRQIAAFARPIVEGLAPEDDGALPDFDACESDGPLPIVMAGKYSAQIDYIVDHLIRTVDFGSESVVFLQPRAGGWFGYLRGRLRAAGLPWTELTRASVWPAGPEAIALCTMHSVKGLEFDHVIMPGLNAEVTPHGNEEGDAQLDVLRRLIAMGLGRARRSVVVGYKPDDPSTILSLLKPDTFKLVNL